MGCRVQIAIPDDINQINIFNIFVDLKMDKTKNKWNRGRSWVISKNIYQT